MASVDTETLNHKRNAVITHVRKQMNGRFTIDKKHLRVRCPFCGDSINRESAHLYISVEPPFPFSCKRCPAQGSFSDEFIAMFKINTSELRMTVKELNKHASYNSRNKRRRRQVGVKEYYLSSYNSESARRGLTYFNSRFNTNYDISDLQMLEEKYKIIFDTERFFKYNKIKLEEQDFFDYKNSIGFISGDKSYCNFRSYLLECFSDNDMSYDNEKASKIFKETKNIRYKLLHVNKKVENPRKDYFIRNNVSLLKIKTNLILAEGVFDIIGVYEHLYRYNTDVNLNENYIFIAVNGKDYAAVIDKYRKLGFLDLDISIFSDKEVDHSLYANIKKQSKYNIDKITLYYNDDETEKDFGVAKDKIIIRKVVI